MNGHTWNVQTFWLVQESLALEKLIDPACMFKLCLHSGVLLDTAKLSSSTGTPWKLIYCGIIGTNAWRAALWLSVIYCSPSLWVWQVRSFFILLKLGSYGASYLAPPLSLAKLFSSCIVKCLLQAVWNRSLGWFVFKVPPIFCHAEWTFWTPQTKSWLCLVQYTFIYYLGS